jgi:Tol biopolymer transport system component
VRIALLVSTALLIGVAAARLGTAEAAFPGANGRIAFLHSSSEFWEAQLYLMNPDGSDQTRISNGGYHYDPAWSADGSKLAFAWADNSNSDIWVARADYTDRRQITSGTPYDNSPAWSPDGRWLAFDRYESAAPSETDVYVVGAAGGTPINLTEHAGRDEQPSWSSDGSRIAFKSDRSPEGVYIMNIDGSNQHVVAQAGFSPDWSPNGTRIVYAAVTYEPPAGPAPATGPPPPPQPRDHLWLVNPDGSNRHQLTFSPGTQSEPSWSPDGTKIAYHGLVVDRNEVFVLDVASGSKTQLTHEGNYSPTWQPLVPPPPPPPPPGPPGPPPGPPAPPPPHGDPVCRVPRVIGMRLRRARAAIVRAHCSVGRIRRARSRRPRNVVIGQSPSAGKSFRVGYRAPVKLVVSRGRR